MALKTLGNVEVYRPMQYLGSKLRSLEAIGQAIKSLNVRPRDALDLFSGSSVVAQYMKKAGMRVDAIDAMKFCATVAEATIGNVDFQRTPNELMKLIGRDTLGSMAWKSLGSYVNEEKNAIEQNKPDVLFEMYHTLPQIWRGEFQDSSQIHNISNKCGFESGDIFSKLYAGTYFGVDQAITIDYIRNRIEEVKLSAHITRSEEVLLLTALLSAISRAVFSAGKHFAQPHLIRDGKDLSFVSKRIVEDRSINILNVFEFSLNELYEFRRRGVSNDSTAKNDTLENILFEGATHKYDLIYVDPPYTAQQYSRFYHIPEVLMEYRLPKLQTRKGKVTKGLYPVDRFKSRFCSKRNAKDAFSDIFTLASKSESSLIINYSLSKREGTGNERMISFEELLSMCEEYSGRNLNVIEFDHTYRQFNKKSLINNFKEDKEIQIVCPRP